MIHICPNCWGKDLMNIKDDIYYCHECSKWHRIIEVTEEVNKNLEEIE